MAATFDGMEIWGIDYKVGLFVAQLTGYALSKFIGIKFISELRNERRLPLLIGFLVAAWLAMVGFAFTPLSAGPFWLFINGMPLGMIWGIVFTYCEGRRLTEVITVILTANFIISSGIIKTIGRLTLAAGVSEQMMPVVVGMMAFPLLALAGWMLSVIPDPAEKEIVHKAARKPMSRLDKGNLLRRYALPLILFVVIYLCLTVIRDIRDNFAVEIWTEMGFGENPAIYSTTELPVTLVVLLALGALFMIRNNRKALLVNTGISLFGFILIAGTTLLHILHLLPSIPWMIISGIGLFLPYILLNGIIFDRFIANFRIIGNVGFIMYIADATGYAGTITVVLSRNFAHLNIQWLEFYHSLCLIGSGIGILLVLTLFFYFRKKSVPPAP